MPAGNALIFDGTSSAYTSPAGDSILFGYMPPGAGDFTAISADGLLDLYALASARKTTWLHAVGFIAINADAAVSLARNISSYGTIDLKGVSYYAPTWYTRQPLIGGSGKTPGGIGFLWSPQQRIDNNLTAPHVGMPKKEHATRAPWAELENIAPHTCGGWAQIPKLERQGRHPWADIENTPETHTSMSYTEPPAKDVDAPPIGWDDSTAPCDQLTGMPYRVPPPKQLEHMFIPWGKLDEFGSTIGLPYSAPPPKDVDKPIISGPHWYPRWCIWQYQTPNGAKLIFNFSGLPYKAAAGNALIFSEDSTTREHICYDGTYNGPKDGYWYQPHDWVLPPTDIRSFYLIMHNVSLKRVADSVPIPIMDMRISTDMDSWCWSISANLRRKIDLDLVRPSGGAPVEVEASINGTSWRFIIENYGDDRQFGQYGFSISGRSSTAVLSAPYSLPTSLLQTANRTANQLADEAVENSGFTLSWQLTDWLVLGGVYSVSNQTPIQQLLTIAAAAGGVVQSTPLANTLNIVPWYTYAPWTWGTQTPAAILPTFKTRRTSYQPQPEFDGVYISGQNAGVTCLIKRTGTDGAKQPQMITDPLITATEAALQRGQRILADSGARSIESISAPLLDSPGLLTPGMLIGVVDGTETWRGQVISTSLSCARPTITQDISVLRYYGS